MQAETPALCHYLHLVVEVRIRTTALIPGADDRLVHHRVILELNIPGYRLEKAKKTKGADRRSRPKTRKISCTRMIFDPKIKQLQRIERVLRHWRALSRKPIGQKTGKTPQPDAPPTFVVAS